MRTLFTIHSNFYLDQYFSGTYSVKGTIYMYMNARGGGCPFISCYPFSFVFIDNDTNFQRNITSIFFNNIYKTIQAIQGKYIQFDQFSEDQHLPSLTPIHISILTIWKVVTFF